MSAPDMEGVNCFGIPSKYRGWEISQGPDDNFYGFGPNYDASYEGPEDGWVDNGESRSASTWDSLREEIDEWFAEREEADRAAVVAPFAAIERIFDEAGKARDTVATRDQGMVGDGG